MLALTLAGHSVHGTQRGCVSELAACTAGNGDDLRKKILEVYAHLVNEA